MTQKNKESQKNENTAIVPKAELAPAIPNPGNMLTILAATPNVSPEIVAKFMDLQDRWEEKQAKKAFDESMAELQANLPIIKKLKPGGKTNSGVVAYYYAPIESIVQQAGPAIARYGFSYRILTGVRDNRMLFAECIVKHKLGHTETTAFEVPPGTGTNIMSAPQIQAATYTFCKRYAFCNAFGIMTGDEDTDAQKEKEVNVAEQFSPFNQAMSLIKGHNKPANLEMFRKQINDNAEFTNQEKIKLIGMINEKLHGK